MLQNDFAQNLHFGKMQRGSSPSFELFQFDIVCLGCLSVCPFICLITAFPFECNDGTSHLLTKTWGGPLLILGSINEVHGQTSHRFCTITHYLFTYNNDTIHILPVTWEGLILVSRGRRSTSDLSLNVASFPHSNSTTFWPAIMILQTCCLWPEEDSCWFKRWKDQCQT